LLKELEGPSQHGVSETCRFESEIGKVSLQTLFVTLLHVKVVDTFDLQSIGKSWETIKPLLS
jgi:hypothetical protein